MNRLLVIILQTNDQHQHIAGWVITALLVVIIAFVVIRKFLKKRGQDDTIQGKYFVPPTAKVSVIKNSQEDFSATNNVSSSDEFHDTENIDEDPEEETEDDSDDDDEELFDKESTRLGLVPWDINHDDASCVVTTKKGLYTITNDNEVYLDENLVVDFDQDISEVLITPEGKVYTFDEDLKKWFVENNQSIWMDYRNEQNEEFHPEGELEFNDDEVVLNDKVLYSGQYDSYSCHPNFGVIVADGHKVFINNHLNYEGYHDDFYPDPEGLVLQVEDDYFLIPKNIPTPDLMASMNEDEYDAVVSNSDPEFVKNRILNLYSGRLIQKDFDGEVWVSQKGLFFRPAEAEGTLYLRDQLVYQSEKADTVVENVFMDGDDLFVQDQDSNWYQNGKLIYDDSYKYQNFYGTVNRDHEEWDCEEVWPDGNIVQEKKGEYMLYKNGSEFFNAPFSDWYMHPSGIVFVSKDDEQLFFFSFTGSMENIAPHGITS